MLSFVKRALAAFLTFVVVRGLFGFLALYGIHPDAWVATALGDAVASPGTQILAFWVLPSAFALTSLLFWRQLEDFVKKLIGRSPLEINFDSANPGKKFWSLEPQKAKDGSELLPVCWQYRVEIENKSAKTLKNLRVSAETIGQLGARPMDMPFDKTQGTVTDLNPRCAELVTVLRWPYPTIQAGMLAGESAQEYGPVKVIASADNVPPAVRVFKFDYQKTPMLFD